MDELLHAVLYQMLEKLVESVVCVAYTNYGPKLSCIAIV